MFIKYETHNFKPETLALIDGAVAICEEYAADGLSLTLRQLFYQHVARGLLPNTQKSYDRLGETLSKARLAGMFDWDWIVDRTRNLSKRSTWGSPEKMIESAAKQYLTDTWAPQKRRIEVWVEKDAAIGVVEAVCERNNVPYFSCRGYGSTSEMWAAGVRIGEYLRNGEQTRILHIGDHDPSGLNMTQDIEKRLRLFVTQDWLGEFPIYGSVTRGQVRESQRERMRQQGSEIEDDELPWEVRRIALTLEQIETYDPPPNPAKQSDSRFNDYVAATGLTESWELDALEPHVMEDLIQDEIDAFMDHDAFGAAEMAQEKDRALLLAVKDNWTAIAAAHGRAK